jgi:hypothetical protein
VSRLRLTALLLVVLVAVAVASASGGARRTTIHYYVAFKDGKLAPGLGVVRRFGNGLCDSPRRIPGRGYVWHCFFGDHIVDHHCLSATPSGTGVVCPLAPWSKRVIFVQFEVGWRPKQIPLLKAALPWGIWTSTGKRCGVISTGTSIVNGMRINYGCDGGGYLAGPINRDTTPWTISFGTRYVGNGGHTRLTRAGITDAWW